MLIANEVSTGAMAEAVDAGGPGCLAADMGVVPGAWSGCVIEGGPGGRGGCGVGAVSGPGGGCVTKEELLFSPKGAYPLVTSAPSLLSAWQMRHG